MDIVKRKNENTDVESTRGNLYRSPEADIVETDNAYILTFDLPGVEKDDINLNVEKDVLSLTAECSKKAGEGYSCLKDEMIYSGFKRSFDLGNSVSTDKIHADYADGTLALTLPKKEEQKTKQITIEVK